MSIRTAPGRGHANTNTTATTAIARPQIGEAKEVVPDRAPRQGRQDQNACTGDANDPASVFHARDGAGRHARRTTVTSVLPRGLMADSYRPSRPANTPDRCGAPPPTGGMRLVRLNVVPPLKLIVHAQKAPTSDSCPEDPVRTALSLGAYWTPAR